MARLIYHPNIEQFTKEKSKVTVSDKHIGWVNPESYHAIIKKAFGKFCHWGKYDSTDTVYLATDPTIDKPFPFDEMDKAIVNYACFVTDRPYERLTNLSQKELAEYLKKHDYVEMVLDEYSWWRPANPPPPPKPYPYVRRKGFKK